MIRKFKEQDLGRLMEIWLETNRTAHDFIEVNYWKNNYPLVKEKMPEATIYVYEQDTKVIGFVGLSDTYIAGIFVEPNHQSSGIGKKLLASVQTRYDELFLHVYKKNKRAVKFYLREGFLVVNEQMDETTNEVELFMEWRK